MREAGHRITFAGERGLWHQKFIDGGWTWIEAPMKGGPLALIKSTRMVRKALNGQAVDVLHAHFRKSAIVARRLQRSGRPPLLYTLHGSHIPTGGIWKMLSDYGDRVHVPSSEARQWLIDQAGVDAEKITLIPHGIHTDRFPVADDAARQKARAALGLSENDLVALYLGRLEFQKNESWMLDLAERSRDALPALNVLMAGEGPNEAEVRQQIAGRNLTDRVRLLGHREPLGVLQAADALLLPSLREGFSYACAEAMCAGVPVLRTRTSGTKELIVEGLTGRSVEIDNEAFVRGSIEFLSDRVALKKMGTAAAEHIRRNFTFDRQLQQTLELYEQMIR